MIVESSDLPVFDFSDALETERDLFQLPLACQWDVGTRPPPPHSSETDEAILKLIEQHGHRWKVISDALGGPRLGFTVDSVRGRALRLRRDPTLSERTGRCASTKPKHKKRPPPMNGAFYRWTKREDDVLVQKFHEKSSWASISRVLKRTPHACRNRMSRLFPERDWRAPSPEEM